MDELELKITKLYDDTPTLYTKISPEKSKKKETKDTRKSDRAENKDDFEKNVEIKELISNLPD
jgi:hypothetical protein